MILINGRHSRTGGHLHTVYKSSPCIVIAEKAFSADEAIFMAGSLAGKTASSFLLAITTNFWNVPLIIAFEDRKAIPALQLISVAPSDRACLPLNPSRSTSSKYTNSLPILRYF